MNDLQEKANIKETEGKRTEFNVAPGETHSSVAMTVTEHRDRYVQEQLREILFSMKESKIPKGVIFSNIFMSAPLMTLTLYLAILTPMAGNLAFVDPTTYAMLARSALRLLSLNIGFFGGIHYGLASATYETAITEEEIRRIKYQMMFSFVPGAIALCTTQIMLFASPLQLSHIVCGFTSLMLTQFVMLQVDKKCVDLELAPVWFKKFRQASFTLYIIATGALFSIFYTQRDKLQRRNDINRITNLKTAMELEDSDFIKMVDEMKIDYDEQDLKTIEREVTSQLNRNGAGAMGI